MVNEVAPWFFPAAAAVFGAITGSFLNVCVYRIPKGLSVVSPGSRCACGAPIPWWRNIPVFAWLIWGRRTPCCERGYSPRYAIVEAMTGALFLLCALTLPGLLAPVGMLLCAWLVVLAFIDLDTMCLPDTPNIGLGLAGLLVSLALPELHGRGGSPSFLGSLFSLGDALLGVALGSALVYWFRLLAGWLMRREAMGEGDVILVGSIGAFLGWRGAIFSFFAGAVYGTVFVLPLMAVRRRPAEAERLANASRASMEGDESDELIAAGADMGIPFGPWIALGAVTYLLGAKPYVNEYFARVAEVFSESR